MRDYIQDRLLRKVFNEKDYRKFLEVTEGKEEELSRIDLSAIDNYNHNILTIFEKDLFVDLYRKIKFYLEQSNFYSAKIQEGMALCIAKTLVIDEFFPSRINNYLSSGDKLTNGDKVNPFEELCRVLLLAVKDEPHSIMFDEVVHPSTAKTANDLKAESKLFLDAISVALDENALKTRIASFHQGDVIASICEDVESSNVESKNPLSASKKENKEVLVEQFNRIFGLYHDKIDCGIACGSLLNCSCQNKLLTKFDNKIIYAKRNIGVYEKTKKLVP